MSNANFHEFPKSFKVRALARHLAHSFQVIPHSCIPRLDIFPRIRYTGFSIVSRSRGPQKKHIFLTYVAVGAIFRTLGYSDGYDILVPGVKADDKVVLVGIIHPVARLLVSVLRQVR